MKNTDNETTNWLKGFLIGALIAIVFVMILAGCEKERCYECTTVTALQDFTLFNPLRLYHDTTRTSKLYCGVTLKDIKQIEKEGTYETKIQTSWSIRRTKVKTTCKPSN